MRYLGPVLATVLAVAGLATVLVVGSRLPYGLRVLSGIVAVLLVIVTVRVAVAGPRLTIVPLGLSAIMAARNALRPLTPRTRESWLYRALTYSPRMRRPR